MTRAPALPVDDRFAIMDVIHGFYRLIDSGQATKTVALFLDDATLVFGAGSPRPGEIRGGAIAAAMAEREALRNTTTRHAISNILLSQGNDGEFRADYLLTLFRADNGPLTTDAAFVADVRDIYLRCDGGWRIAKRTISPIFSRQSNEV
jgi:ketosteroid isomerase-like protein